MPRQSTHSHQKIENDLHGRFFIFDKLEWVDTPEYQRHNKCRLKTIVFVGDSQQDMHGEYADEQLANLQKRICLIEFLYLDLIIVYQGAPT